MKEKFALYRTTKKQLMQWVDLSESLTCVMSWFVIGLIFAQNATLPKIAAKIPGSTKLPSRTQRLWRWLKNPRVNCALLSKSISQRWLANFHDTTIYLVIDRTDINANHWLLFVGLCYRGRAFPLVWKVLPGKGSTSFARQRALLRVIDRNLQTE